MELKTSKPKLVANLFKTYDPIDPYALRLVVWLPASDQRVRYALSR